MGFCSIGIKAANDVGILKGLWGQRSMVGEVIPPLPSDILMTIAVTVIFILLCRFTLLNNTKTRITVRYQIPFFILIVGCMLLALSRIVFPENNLSGTLLFDGLELYASLLSWTIMLSFVQTVNISYYRMVGLRSVLFNALAVVWILVAESNEPLVLSFLILSMFACVIGATAFPFNALRSKADGGQPEDDIHTIIAQEYKLSKREQEVFTLLAQGRNRPNIQKQLQLADGTIKTHSAHIYSKLDVHSQQELLDLVSARKNEQ